ncbi:CDP-archaeol synthase [Sulfuriflexus mobilis]|uniref:CDP-archaeol synthase n=1 Tax=Sulfuriflexus mobilis TaxID=1811807 RepID=UPI000F83C931|nr:CDP-archaeol synthase [Sulfuriflexus mobilis]
MMLELLLLILVASGAPVVISYLFQHRASLPVDFGLMLADKQRCFGEHKTWRGLFASAIATIFLARLLGFDYLTGLQVSSLAMTGDLFSSFIKRRLGKKAGARFLFLDQVPESLLPAWLFMEEFSLGWGQVIGMVAAFIVIEQVLSVLFYKLGVRKSPY